MKFKLVTLLASVCIALSLTACAGKSKKADVADESAESTGVSQTDITRPPAVTKRKNQNTETNPDETVSFDEWKKQQQAQ